ncbi:hypothetical protein [uncultured Microbulbifer sp.]|uniref:hypothetical protein n=1 Tax=uncultured Microbulbifer sp. TaxID=348147 RepID=UPI00263707CB|nr:hypothetical protein [uncultured Microbulbifer sp.]
MHIKIIVLPPQFEITGDAVLNVVNSTDADRQHLETIQSSASIQGSTENDLFKFSGGLGDKSFSQLTEDKKAKFKSFTDDLLEQISELETLAPELSNKLREHLEKMDQAIDFATDSVCDQLTDMAREGVN